MSALTPRKRHGFTLVEMLVSLAIISGLVLLLASVMNQTSVIWRSTTGKTEQFREARAGFEAMTTRLEQATLNTYWDYDNATTPTKYQRRSELRFISGPADDVFGTTGTKIRPAHCVFFGAPFGMTETGRYEGFENLLSTWGYFLEFGDDSKLRPAFLTAQGVPVRNRMRLMELWQPAERNFIYKKTSGVTGRTYVGREWFTEALNAASPPVHVAAENIIALVITPRLAVADEAEVKGAVTAANADLSPLAPNYLFDSSPNAAGADTRYKDARLNPTHQLPPILQVTMVAIDETSALRLRLDLAQPDPFGIKTRFKKSADYSKDLLKQADDGSLEASLINQRITYRIFTTNVLIRGAKWSREQTN